MKFIIKIFLIAYYLLVTAYFSFSQNLVYNGSFEIKDSIYNPYNQEWYYCPFTDDHPDIPMLPIAKGWDNPKGKYLNQWYSSSDYFHSCGNDTANLPNWVVGTSVGVPNNYWLTGYQYARTGEGYSAGVFYGNDNQYTDIDFGEYIQSKLKAQLHKDSVYVLVFYVNRANRCSHSIKSQGAYLTPNMISYGSLLNGIKDSTIIPQVLNNNGYISDTANWTKIEGVFNANGDEEFITLGSFDVRKNLAQFEHMATYYNWAAYAIDDISLYPVNAAVKTAKCGNDSLICLGNSFRLGKTNVQPDYLDDYIFEWYILGKEDSLISTEEYPIVYPKTTTTYILKLTDFKFDKTTDTITVNVIDCSEPTRLLVYPNPTNTLVNFKFNSPIPEQLKIELYDVIGRKIRVTNFQQNYEIKEVQMNFFNLASGMYFYRVVIGNESKFVGKIVLLR